MQGWMTSMYENPLCFIACFKISEICFESAKTRATNVAPLARAILIGLKGGDFTPRGVVLSLKPFSFVL